MPASRCGSASCCRPKSGAGCRGSCAASRPGHPVGWQFIDLAGLGGNTARSYATALLRIILYPLATAVLLGVAVGITILVSRPAPAWLDPIVGILAQYGLIVVAGLAVLRGVERSHQRPWRSLVAPDLRIDWRRLAIGGGAEIAILGGQLALVHALTGWPWRLVIPANLPVFVLGVLLIPLQSASEEILFRGYLTQALGRISRSRLLIAATVGLVFGTLHLNVHGPLTMLYYLVLSVD